MDVSNSEYQAIKKIHINIIIEDLLKNVTTFFEKLLNLLLNKMPSNIGMVDIINNNADIFEKLRSNFITFIKPNAGTTLDKIKGILIKDINEEMAVILIDK